MEHLLLSPHHRISDILALSPAMTPVFIELRVGCIGCSMNRFCTLRTLCRQYELDIGETTKILQSRLAQAEENI